MYGVLSSVRVNKTFEELLPPRLIHQQSGYLRFVFHFLW